MGLIYYNYEFKSPKYQELWKDELENTIFNMQKYYDGVSQSIADVKEQALEQLRQNAEKINANAVVGILVDIEVKSSEYLIVATVTGTAVSIIKR